LKIAYLADAVPDIYGTTRYQRARHLSETNDLFLFLRESSQLPEEIAPRVTVERSRFNLFPFFYLWRIYKVWRANRKAHFDFVYTFYSPFSIIEGFFLKLAGFKWVADIWDHPKLPLELSPLMDSKTFLRRLIKRSSIALSKKFLKHADLVICAIMPEALNLYNIAPQKILPITNGVDLKHTNSKGKKKNNNEFKILYVGFVYKVRGVDTLLKSLSKLDKSIPVKLSIAGKIDHETETWLSDFISSNNLENSVEILGEIPHEEVLALMEDSNVCVCPFPRKEELEYIYPIKVLEYLAMSKPVIATNLKGISRIIKHEEDGLLVEPDNPDEMANAILRIYQDKELREKLERNARESVLKYDWHIIHEKIDNALNDLRRG
jgi:glycosyltransferase involved in cell wall biosynthesis